MKNKYNLALIPLDTSKSNQAITFAQKFTGLADKYLLGEKSHPHVTLYQFEADENEIDSIWERVRKAWQEKPINLEFKEFSCLTFDNQVHWISLLPSNCDVLHKMHRQIADLIKLPTKKSFDPHMTLISTKNTEYKKEVDEASKLYTPIVDAFVLALGKSDEVGQLTDLISKHRAPLNAATIEPQENYR